MALIAYGLIGIGMLAGALATGATTWAELRAGWAEAGTELVFLAWGVTLAVAATGYHRTTRPVTAGHRTPVVAACAGRTGRHRRPSGGRKSFRPSWILTLQREGG
ncbi:hypothetical protein AAH979_08425 [Plantactinospora sp. ZYX-F-223]|uniref:hypothetical protein n=1 Tax=Plantactinospora sp. ZYX-F-223 TaxID=3144103 RepID=UPI0031FBD1DD